MRPAHRITSFTASALAVLALSTGITACGAAPASSTHATPALRTGAPGTAGGEPLWLISGSALRLIAAAPAARAALDRSSTLVIVNSRGAGIPAHWAVRGILGFTSEAELAKTVESGKVPASVFAVGYDNEAWNLTPSAERADPAHYEALAASVAAAHHLQYVQLGNLPAYGNPVYGARYASFLDIQAQSREKNPAIYTNYVRTEATAARKLNPAVVVIAGLSTNPPAGAVTAQELYADVNSTRSYVDGYWLNIPSPGVACPRCGLPEPGIAVGLLTLLDSAD